MEKKTEIYPKWLYHAKKDAVMVKSEAEEKELGSGWVESPALVKEETKPTQKTKAKAKSKPRKAK